MVILRIFFQVAVGILGFFPSSCYAAQQRPVPPQPRGPSWGPPRLPRNAEEAAAEVAESVVADAAAAASSKSGRSKRRRASEGAAGAVAPSPRVAAAGRAGVVERSHRGSVASSAPPSPVSSDDGIDDEAMAEPVSESMSDLEIANLYEMVNASDRSDSPAEEARQEEALMLKQSRRPFFLNPFSPRTPEEAINPFSGRLKGHAGFASFLLQSPFVGPRPFRESPRLKRAVEVQAGRLISSALTMCGRREQDEDTLVVDAWPADSPFVVKALFDGHGGRSAADFCSSHVHTFLNGLKSATPDSLMDAFLMLDEALIRSINAHQSGSTGVVALMEELKEPRQLLVSGREVLSSASAETLQQKLEPEDRVGSAGGSPTQIVLGGASSPGFLVTIANVGDSRATLFHAEGGFTIMSRDHKPTNPEEQRRIEAAGGFVSHSPASVPRVDGILALSRAFGDALFKDNKNLGPREQRVVAVPEVHTFYAVPGDVLMLACDGVYEPESMNWVFVSHFMLTLLHELQNDLTEAGVKLLEHAYHSLSGDNISVLLTRFEGGERFERKARRFQVTPDGHIVPDEYADPLSPREVDGEEALEAQKGPMLPTDANPITL
ncbi:hypothetical protein Efla_000667 [Eimeria flavescens]